jgi:hypothetical protein
MLVEEIEVGLLAGRYLHRGNDVEIFITAGDACLAKGKKGSPNHEAGTECRHGKVVSKAADHVQSLFSSPSWSWLASGDLARAPVG